MRRTECEITDLNKLKLVMKACDVCRVAFHGDEYPYIVPMNFGMDEQDGTLVLYFHGAAQGKKHDLMKQNSNVCFEMDTNHEFVYDVEEACRSTMKYVSVCGTGKLMRAADEEKHHALTCIMKQYHPAEHYHFDEKAAARTAVLKLIVNTMSGKAK